MKASKSSPRAKFAALFLTACILGLAASIAPQQKQLLHPLREIYIVPVLGHLDYGFTATQREVKALWPDIYRKGIKFLEDYPDARLTSDCLLPVEWFHDVANKDEWGRFQALVKSGRWELTAALLHANTSVLTQAEASRLFLDSRRWSEALGAPIKNWIHADVPGLTWNMAETATDSGIKFIAVGANEMNGLSPLPPALPSLFYWEAPDGERILVSLRGGSGYMEGGLDLALHVREGLEDRLTKFEQILNKKYYPLDKALVLFSSGDNNGPEVFPALINTVEKWNKENHFPKLRITTLSEFQKALSNEELSKIPVVRGDWPASGTWEALVRRSLHAESAARAAKRKLLAAQLLTIITGDKKEAAQIRDAWREVLLYDEHSGVGAWPGKLTREQLIEQNETEYQLAINAAKDTESSIQRSAISDYFQNFYHTKSGVPIICNTTDTSRGQFLEWSGQSAKADSNNATYFDDKMPGWSCGFAENSMIKLAPRSKEKLNLPMQFKNFWRFDPPFSMNFNYNNVWPAVELPVYKNVYTLPNKEYMVKLTWGPVSKLSSVQKVTSLEGMSTFRRNTHLFNLVRGDILLSEKLILEKPPAWEMPIEGVIAEDKNGFGTLISSMDGLPASFSPERRKNLWWLLYLQEIPATFRDGTTDLVPNEPAVYDKPIQSLWVIKEIKGTPTNFITQLRDMSRPLEAVTNAIYDPAPKKEPAYTLNTFRTFSSSSPFALIEEIKWADFGDGIIISIRNISNRNLSTTIISHSSGIESAELVDGLEVDLGTLEHGAGWVRIKMGPMEFKHIRLTLNDTRSD